MEPDRRDPRNRALRRLLQSQADYAADQERRDPAPAGIGLLQIRPGPMAAQALERMSRTAGQAVASFRVRPVEEDADGAGAAEPVAAVRYLEPEMMRYTQGANLFDADQFDTSRKGAEQ